MVILKTPKDLNNYICVHDKNIIFELYTKGYMPIYRDRNGLYFKKNNETEKIVNVMRL